MTIVILGIDLGKNSCSVVGLDKSGAVVLRRRMRRQTILGFAAKLPGCVIAMEACCGAHYLGRLLMVQGHTVRLMSPQGSRIKPMYPKNKPTVCAEVWSFAGSVRGIGQPGRLRNHPKHRTANPYA
jgi:transposase